MIKNLKQKIALLLLVALTAVNLIQPLSSYAQGTPPEPPQEPTGPSAPQGPGPGPSAPTGPSEPSAPTGPSSPSAPSGPSGPTGPYPTEGSTLPTQAPLPTESALPTESPLTSSGATGPSGSSSSTGTTGSSGSGTDSGSGGGSNGSVNDPYNYQTGPYSSNYGQEIIDQSMAQVNKNLAEMQNKIDAMTQTGFNNADLNTLTGAVISGDANSTVNLLNKLNSNILGLGNFLTYDVYGLVQGNILLNFANGLPIDAFTTGSANVSKNAVTGPGSENTAIQDQNFEVKEANGNDATLVNDINLVADSGNNSASFNTGDGIVQTGEANALANIINMVNTNLNVAQWMIGVINIYGTLLGDIIFPAGKSGTADNSSGGSVTVGNSATGPMSENFASYESSTSAEFTNNNTADIVSDVSANANTGNNTASINTGGGLVMTGSADASVSNSTTANYNSLNEEDTVYMIFVNELGRWVGYIVGQPLGISTASNALPITTESGGLGDNSFSVTSENTLTGPLSDNYSEVNQTSSTSVKNINDASITNNITANANSGNNSATYNTGAGIVDTGDAQVGVNLANLANVNVTATKFVLLFVNVIGDFLGNIVPSEEEALETGNSLPSLEPLPTEGPLPTQTPLPILAPEDDDPLIGGTENTDPLPQEYYYGPTYDGAAYGNEQYYYYYYPEEYSEAVNQVNYQKLKANVNKYLYRQGVVVDNLDNPQTVRVIRRGVYLSPNFAKAVESSLAAVLLGGISLKVTNSWLLVIPFALFIFFARRRKRININWAHYVDTFLEIIL